MTEEKKPDPRYLPPIPRKDRVRKPYAEMDKAPRRRREDTEKLR